MLPLLAACVPPTPVDFGDPALLAPLEAENDAPDPVVGEGLTMVSGQNDEHHFAHARGLLPDAPADVWEAMRHIEVMADRREVAEYTSEENVELDFDFSYLIHNRVTQPLRVNFDITWVHELQEGEISAPQEVVIRWDKTDGTQFIEKLSGSVVLTAAPEGTELAFIEHLDAAARDELVLEQFLRDVFTDIEAVLAGEAFAQY